MGCFDVSCGTSSISIKSGDDALILLLIPKMENPRIISMVDKKKVEIEQGLQQVFNEGPLGMYMPFCMPIRGKYNDYGSLEDVVKDETVQGLEKHFDMNILNILNIIQRNHYGNLFADEIIKEYGNGLSVDSYKKVNQDWMKKAGFILQEDEKTWIHKDIKNVKKWDGKAWIDTDVPRIQVVFKVPENSNHEKDPLPHIISYKGMSMNDVMEPEETWVRNQREFCERFYDASKRGGFWSKHGDIVLGIKPDYIEKAKLLLKMSGMFIDGSFYDSFTKNIQTNQYAREHSDILGCYPSQFMMDRLGFKFSHSANPDDLTNPIEVTEGTFDYKSHDKIRVYEHDLAPNMLFSVRYVNNMCIEFYRKNKKGKYEEVKTWKGGNSKSYSNYNASNVAEFFKAETGNDLDLSELSKMTHTEHLMLKMQDMLNRRAKDKVILEEIEAQLKELREKGNEDDKKTELVLQRRLIDNMSDGNRSRELMNFNMPLFDEMYAEHFLKPSTKFEKDVTYFNIYISSLWGINRPLMPSSHFGQHGDHMNHLFFNKMVLDVVRTKMLKEDMEFYEKDVMLDAIKMLYGDDVLISKKSKKETVYKYDNEEVAIWVDDKGYGYLSSSN